MNLKGLSVRLTLVIATCIYVSACGGSNQPENTVASWTQVRPTTGGNSNRNGRSDRAIRANLVTSSKVFVSQERRPGNLNGKRLIAALNQRGVPIATIAHLDRGHSISEYAASLRQLNAAVGDVTLVVRGRRPGDAVPRHGTFVSLLNDGLAACIETGQLRVAEC